VEHQVDERGVRTHSVGFVLHGSVLFRLEILPWECLLWSMYCLFVLGQSFCDAPLEAMLDGTVRFLPVMTLHSSFTFSEVAKLWILSNHAEWLGSLGTAPLTVLRS
jgi:hypothetical protein